MLFVACSSSQEFTYRPLNNPELWNIRIEKGSVSGQFEVYVNDEMIFEETPSMFTDSIDEKSDYKGHQFRFMVNKTTDFWGGEEYKAILFCDNEMISRTIF
jgi:hypothetical protein